MELIEKPIYRYTELDSGKLCKLFRQKDVYIPSGDDYTNPGDIQNFIDNALLSELFFILGRNPKKEAVIFAPSHNFTTYQAHFAFSEDNRDNVVKTVREAGLWLVENTKCESVIAFIRKENKGARSVVGQIGLSRCGKVKGSVRFNGELVDEIIYQMTKEDFLRG